MKLIIERSHALAALSRIIGVVARNSNVAILNNVLITAAGGTVVFRATDLDIEATSQCPAEISEAGELTVDAGKLREVVASAAPGAQISIELDGTDDPRLIVKSGRSRFKLPVLAADMFPKIGVASGDTAFKITASDLTRILKNVVSSASTEASRYYLCGVHIHVINGMLRSVATNGHVLSYQEVIAPDSAKNMKPVTIPTKTVAEIIKAVDGKSGDVTVKVGPASVSIEIDDYSLKSKVIDGSFPDYARIIPKNTTSVSVVDSDTLSMAVQRAAIAADGKTKSAVLSFTTDFLEVTGRGQSEARDEVECEHSGGEIKIMFNSAYILQITNQIDGAIEIAMSDNSSPTSWRAANDDSFLCILTPMRQ